VSDESRMVSAPVFLLWWERLHELDQDVAAPGCRGDRGKVSALLAVLRDVGQMSGAIRNSITNTGYGAGSSVPVSAVPNTDFDWERGEIDFAPLHPYAPDDREETIAAIIRLTGIGEHDTEAILPMVARRQQDDAHAW
jgi:hypothetical protein